MTRMLACIVAPAAALAVLAAPMPAAADFPEREVIVVVPWSPGGRTDVAVRIWAPYLEEELGVPVVVDNRAGGGGLIGARGVAQAEPDGHTVGVFSITHIISQWTSIPPFELDEYEPVALPYSAPFVLAVRDEGAWEDVGALVEAGQDTLLSVGVSGTGTSAHIAAAAFADAAGIDARLVPYDGDAGAVTALVTGEVEAAVAPLVAMTAHIDAGEIRPIGASLAEPDELHAGIDTFADHGVDLVLTDMGSGIYAPRGTPEDVLERWEEALAAAFAREDLRDELARFGLAVTFVGREEFKAMIEAVNPPLEQLVDQLGLKLGG
jgi:tripartite-type tricarboxylate transporter receptor subunit TctC